MQRHAGARACQFGRRVLGEMQRRRERDQAGTPQFRGSIPPKPADRLLDRRL